MTKNAMFVVVKLSLFAESLRSEYRQLRVEGRYETANAAKLKAQVKGSTARARAEQNRYSIGNTLNIQW
jgi:hypothetical protein